MFNFFKKDKPEEHDHWESYHGGGNSNEVLAEKAKILAVIIVDWVRTGTLQLIECIEEDAKDKKPKEKFAEIFLESVVLYVHVADRIAFQLLKTEQRDFFMDSLMDEFADFCSEIKPTQEGKAKLTSIVRDMYNERQVEYGNYTMAPTENEGRRGTLFWEFSKKIADIVEFEKDVSTMIQVKICIVGPLEFLQLPKLFEE